MSPLFPDEAARSGWDWSELPPDPVIEAYKKDVDRTLLRENLKLTVEQRMEKFESFMAFVEEVRRSAGKGGA